MAKLCRGSGPGAGKAAEEYLSSYIAKQDWDSCKGLIIENNSSYPLEYVNSGYNAGYPVEPVLNVFEKSGDDRVIPPNSAAALVWRLHCGGNFGKWVGDLFSLGIAASGEQTHISAYVSVKVPCPGKNHIVAMGFTQGRNRCDKAGIQIRGEDGTLDGQGNITGHGTDPTGNVSDIAKLAKAVPFGEAETVNGIGWHEFREECRALRVTCRQNNEWKGRVIFTFKDGRDQ